ncbi:MAG: hypothetical protein WBQ16_00230 [Nitrososphaeraceae archaeon]
MPSILTGFLKLTLVAKDMSKYLRHHIFVFTTGFAFPSFVVLNPAYSGGYKVNVPTSGATN